MTHQMEQIDEAGAVRLIQVGSLSHDGAAALAIFVALIRRSGRLLAVRAELVAGFFERLALRSIARLIDEKTDAFGRARLTGGGGGAETRRLGHGPQLAVAADAAAAAARRGRRLVAKGVVRRETRSRAASVQPARRRRARRREWMIVVDAVRFGAKNWRRHADGLVGGGGRSIVAGIGNIDAGRRLVVGQSGELTHVGAKSQSEWPDEQQWTDGRVAATDSAATKRPSGCARNLSRRRQYFTESVLAIATRPR